MDTKSRIAHFQSKLDAEWGPQELERHRSDSNLVIVDTRDPESYAAEHIPGAISIPLPDLEKRMTELPKKAVIVTYCWDITCHVATLAALALAKAGYDVKELAGGIEGWKIATGHMKSKP